MPGIHFKRWLSQWQAIFPVVYKGGLLLISVLLIVQLFPRRPGFGFEYQIARPWVYEDLIAPFHFAILKSDAEIQQEQEDILDGFIPFFVRDSLMPLQQLTSFAAGFEQAWLKQSAASRNPGRKDFLFDLAIGILDSLYHRGIIFLEEGMHGTVELTELRLIEGNQIIRKNRNDFFTVPQAFGWIDSVLDSLSVRDAAFLRPLMLRFVAHNVFYDEAYTQMALDAALAQVSPSRGMVQQGEKIVSRGELLSAEKIQWLDSFRNAYEKHIGETSVNALMYAGQFLLVSISMVVLLLFLYVFRRDVYADNRRIMLILISLLLMVLLTSRVIHYRIDFLYLLPVCIVPVIIRAFFDNRLALYVHIITIILIGFLVPRSFEFVFMQFLAGILAILSMVNLRRRSQLFYTVLLIFLTYAAVYTGLTLGQSGTTEMLHWRQYAYFGGAAALTLFAYPLIFLLERIFRFPTDFSLLELSDTNNPLLRRLAMMAPGTFQHSLQVANLAEEAIFAIGGNALLTRTGALYHDIGKMDDAQYFTENQTVGYNPHEELGYEESAAIIIGHVARGVEMARKSGIPAYIIDFIRTHHGTTTARYFYTMQLKESQGRPVDKKAFSYPGPKPFSKETAVVMMADSVEAASRSLVRPDEKAIGELVEKIFETQIAERQFDNAQITFRDISHIKQVFKRRLINIFHVRVAYPSIK